MNQQDLEKHLSESIAKRQHVNNKLSQLAIDLEQARQYVKDKEQQFDELLPGFTELCRAENQAQIQLNDLINPPKKIK